MKLLISIFLLVQIPTFGQSHSNQEVKNRIQLELVAQNIKLLLKLDKISNEINSQVINDRTESKISLQGYAWQSVIGGAASAVSFYLMFNLLRQSLARTSSGRFGSLFVSPSLSSAASASSVSITGLSASLGHEESIETLKEVGKAYALGDNELAQLKKELEKSITKIIKFARISFELSARETEKLRIAISNEYSKVFYANNHSDNIFEEEIQAKPLTQIMIDNNIKADEVKRLIKIRKTIEDQLNSIKDASNLNQVLLKQSLSNESLAEIQNALIELLSGKYTEINDQVALKELNKQLMKLEFIKTQN